jgi:prepilin-type N-terminal cleavage/methylation domain-containing protein
MIIRFGRSGFSLIEILIAVAVAAILTGVGIAQYSRFNDRQKIKQAADDFVTNFRLIQKRIDGGEKGTCSSPISYYEISRQGSKKYKLIAYCGEFVDLETFDVSGNFELLNNSLFKHPQPTQQKHLEFFPLGKGMKRVDVVRIGKAGCYVDLTVGMGGIISVGDVTGC